MIAIDGDIITNTPATGAPAITGTGEVGQTLTATTTAIADTNGLSSATYSYQWVRIDGTTETEVGTDSNEYVPVTADLGKRLKVVVSFTDDVGFDETRESEAVLLSTTPLAATLELVDTVERRSGIRDYRVDVTLNHPIWIPYAEMRDHAVTVTNGTVKRARRITRVRRYIDGRRRMLSRHWRLTIRPSDVDSAATVSLTSARACTEQGALCTPGGGRLSNAPTLELGTRAPLTVSIADTSAAEPPAGSFGLLTFTVTLSRASQQWVEVYYETTTEGTATAGADFRAKTGWFVFAPGETTNRKLRVRLLGDSVDDSGETVVVQLTRAVLVDRYSDRETALAITDNDTATSDDDKATGTITNDGPMPRAWLARFGRTVGAQAVEAIAGRLEGGGGTQVTLGGQTLSFAGARAREDAERAAEAGRSLTAREALRASAFRLSTGGAHGAPAWAAWGRVASGGFDAVEDGMRMDGRVTSAFLGADVERARWLAGVAVSVSEGEGGYAGVESGGDLEGELSALYPYLRLALGEEVHAWGLAGVGEGALEMTHAHRGGAAERYRTDIAMRMAAAGVRGEVLSPAEPGALAVAVKSDALWVRTTSEAVRAAPGGEHGALGAAHAEVTRLRLIVAGSRDIDTGAGTLTPSLELGLRSDAGDADAGTGVEAGAALRYAAGAVAVEGSVRALLAHESSAHEAWGAAGAVRIDPGVSGRGLALALAPAWGAASGGVERLWSLGDARALAGEDGTGLEARSRLEAELGYGLGLERGRGVLTPYAGLSLAGGAGRTLRTGARWRIASAATLALEAARAEAGDGEPPEHTLALRFETRW